MRPLIRTWILCAAVAWAGNAVAAPGDDAGAQYKLAAQLDDSGDYDKALAAIEEGLAIAPKDLRLLGLKGTVLLQLRDYAGALAAYQAYLDAGAKGANRREAEKIINNLRAVRSTFLEITVANGPAAIYLDSTTQGVFCTAAPSCNRAMLPGDYKVIAERVGFERWTGRVAVERDQTAQLSVMLVEKPSLLTVRVAQPGAHITVDGAPYDAPATVAAGDHQVVVALTGYVDARLEAPAHEGKPVELDVALTPAPAPPPPPPPPPPSAPPIATPAGAPVAAPPLALPESSGERHDRRGRVLVGFGLGVGGVSLSSRLTCAMCTYESANFLGGSPSVRVGWFVVARLAVMGEIQVNAQNVKDHVPMGNTIDIREASIIQISFLVAAQYWVTRRFWVKGGIGVTELMVGRSRPDVLPEAPGSGFASMGAAGFELMSRRRFAIDLQARLVQGAYGGSGDMTSISVGVGLNWY